MWKPGKGRTHKSDSRSGIHARDFFGNWSGKLVCDDYAGYNALFERGVIEIGCMAHARRKFHDLYANHRSDLAEEASRHFAALYMIEREARELKLNADGRRHIRQQRSTPIAEALRQWLTRQRGQVPDGSATAKAIEYSLGRCAALIRYVEDGDLPIDNNHLENRIRPVAPGRSNCIQDILARLPTQRASQLEDLLPHRWGRPVESPQGQPW